MRLPGRAVQLPLLEHFLMIDYIFNLKKKEEKQKKVEGSVEKLHIYLPAPAPAAGVEIEGCFESPPFAASSDSESSSASGVVPRIGGSPFFAPFTGAWSDTRPVNIMSHWNVRTSA